MPLPLRDAHATAPLRKDWLHGNLGASHVADALGVMIPPLERFAVRSVRRMAQHARDETQAAALRAFCRQEAQHGALHRSAEARLKVPGFDPQAQAARVDRRVRALEARLSAPVCLAVTVAMEHVFACIGDFMLRERLMQGCDQGMQDLWEWHSVEEIEHKAVAFELLRASGGGWGLRLLGMCVGLPLMLLSLLTCFRVIARQDPDYTRARRLRDRDDWRGRGYSSIYVMALRYALPYLRPSFHPDDADQSALLEAAQQRLALRAAA